MSIGAFALRHGRGLTFFAVTAALAGFLAARALPSGIYPEVSFPREQVVATLAGAPAETVLAGVTRPLEEALAGVPGLVRVKSKTVRGAAEISLYFAPDTDMAAAHPQVLARMADARGVLAPNTEVTAARVLASGFPILSVNVSGPYPASELYLLAQYTLRPALAGLPGVGLVTVQSSDVPEFQVLLSPTRLAAAHLTVPQVADRLRASNQIQAVARLTEAHEMALAVVSGAVTTSEQLSALVVGGSEIAPVRVSDLGRVVEGTVPVASLIRVDGHAGAILNVARRPGGDALALNQAVKRRLAELATSLPPGIVLTPVYEQAEFIADGMRGVRDAVLFGAVFSVLILALFLRDWRATAIAALALPLTLGSTLVVLYALGQTLNVMSLGGLAIAVGLVIDDAVVVVEAIHRHLEAGLEPRAAARAGTDELFWPVLGTTVTTVVVFLPLGFLSGVAGQFFAALSLSLAAAVLLSMPVALLVLPSLAARFLRPLRRPPTEQRLASTYQRVQDFAFRHRRWLLGGAGLFTLLGLLLGTRLPTDFLPEADEGAYVIDYFAPVAASLPEADRLAQAIEAVLRATPEVESFNRRLGTELGPPVATLPSRGDVAVRLRARRKRSAQEIMDEQRERIAHSAPGLRVEFIQVLADMLGDLQGSPEPIEVKFFGPDPAVLGGLASQASTLLSNVPGFVDFFNGDEGCAPELDFVIDPVASARVGLTSNAVADQLASAYLGQVATQVRRAERLEDVRVRLDGVDPWGPPSPQFVDSVRMIGSAGVPVPLAALAQTRRSCPAATLLRENQRAMVHLTARLSGTSLGQAASEVYRRLRGLPLPVGYTWELGGLVDQQRASFRSLLIVLCLATLLVTGVLLFQLRSFRLGMAVLAAAPVATAGALFTLWLTGISLNVSSLMGAILLVGLVVKNGILLLDQAIASEAAGMPPAQALREAARIRLRPILMTTLATLVALLPLVFGVGAGAALHRPLATAVVGGLAFSTGATLLVIPLIASTRRHPGMLPVPRRAPPPA